MSGGANYSIVNRLKKVLLPFLLIVVLAVPFLLLYDDISWYDVMTDSLLLTCKMNGSWWFMQTYVIFVICFPLFAKSFHYKMVWIPLLIVSVLCFQTIATDIRKYSDAVHYVLHYFPLFYSGMIAWKLSLFDLLAKKQWWFKLFLVVGLVIVRFATGWNILNIGLIVAMIIILVDVQEYISERVLKVFNFLGKMSMNMWLIHMFFITYGYHFTNPFTDLVWIYLESLVVAYVVWKLYNRLCGCLK